MSAISDSLVDEFEAAARAFALVVLSAHDSPQYQAAKRRRDCAHIALMAHVQRLEVSAVTSDVRALSKRLAARRTAATATKAKVRHG